MVEVVASVEVKFQIIKLYANAEGNGCYGHIYRSEKEAKENHPGSDILVGYGIIDAETGTLVEFSSDWYCSAEEAEAHLREVLYGKSR